MIVEDDTTDSVVQEVTTMSCLHKCLNWQLTAKLQNVGDKVVSVTLSSIPTVWMMIVNPIVRCVSQCLETVAPMARNAAQTRPNVHLSMENEFAFRQGSTAFFVVLTNNIVRLFIESLLSTGKVKRQHKNTTVEYKIYRTIHKNTTVFSDLS